MSNQHRRFRVALSFPGEHRNFVKQTADCLASQFGQERVLYDAYHEDEFARANLDIYLQQLYHDESDLVAVFLCAEYKKEWCGLEWHACRDLINRRHESSVMLFRFDTTEIPGMYPTTDGYVWIGDRSAADIANFITKRLEINARDNIAVNSRSPAMETHIVRIAPSRLRHGVEQLFGREDELANLDKTWNDPYTHIVTIIAWGGVGKTALVSHWQAGLAKRNYDGASYFDWSFYSQGTRDQGAASADTFIKAALLFFGDKEMAESAAPAWDKGARLAELVAKHRALLVLDGMEPLQHPPGPMTGQLKDPAMTALLKGLAQKNAGLCVVTTRERLTDLDPFSNATVTQWNLHYLSIAAGIALLKQLGVHGSDIEFETLVKDVKGHALTLNLLGRFLRDGYNGDIRKRDLVRFEEADAEEQGGHAFKVMDAYVKWFEAEGERCVRPLALLRLLGLFDRPAGADCLAALCKAPFIPGLTEPLTNLTEAQWNITLKHLSDCCLISVSNENPKSAFSNLQSIDAHPLIREYFAKQLREKNPKGWREGHRRLYEYLTTSTIDKPNPTLEELQPLYQAVSHGCKAGMQQEVCEKVYRDRILKGTGSGGFYAWRKLGGFGACLGAVACFFEEPWKKLSPAISEPDQAWLLSETAFNLRALGRLREAVEPMRAGLENFVRREDWNQAAASASNLSQLELTLGDCTSAVSDARKSVEFADKSEDMFQRMGKRTTLADSLHQAGQRDEAQEFFREAEKIQLERQPEYPMLYSVQGFQYCDLLLIESERAAWQIVLNPRCFGKAQHKSAIPNPKFRDSCRKIEKRGKETLRWWKEVFTNAALLTISFEHLTLGRTSLYLSILDPTDSSSRESAIKNIEQAATCFRSSGTQHHLPRGLLTRSWLRFLQNDLSGCRADLDEAQQIAERGSMQLHLADVHLHRGRLFKNKAELAKARAIIEKCGYWRRNEELEDAEGIIG